MEVWGIVVAAGSGTRFGSPKQFATIPFGAGHERLVDRGVRFAREACGGGVVCVLPPDFAWDGPTVEAAVAGGRTRTESVRAGLTAVPDTAGVIVVHDAARPLASVLLWRAVIEAVTGGADGAVPGVPVTDTIKRVRDGTVVETPPRRELVAVQTPQAFDAVALRRAHGANTEATDDAALVEQAGGTVVVVPGEGRNRKVTTVDDLDFVRAEIGSGS